MRACLRLILAHCLRKMERIYSVSSRSHMGINVRRRQARCAERPAQAVERCPTRCSIIAAEGEGSCNSRDGGTYSLAVAVDNMALAFSTTNHAQWPLFQAQREAGLPAAPPLH